MSVFDVKGVLKLLHDRQLRYSSEFEGPIISKLEIELFCGDAVVKAAVERARRYGRIGPNDPGWVYVLPVDQTHAVENRARSA